MPMIENLTEHFRTFRAFRDWVDWFAKSVEGELQHQHQEIERLQLALKAELDAHEQTKEDLQATTQELSKAQDSATKWQKRFHDAEAKIENAPKAVAEKWLEELSKSQLIGGLDRVICGEAESDPVDFRKRLVNWFGRRVNAKPEEVIAVGRQVVEKDSKVAAQIAWSPDTPFRDDVDAVEVKITHPGLRFGEIVVEHARGNVIEVIYAAPRPVTHRVVELLENLVCSDPTLQADSSRLRALLNDLAPAEPRLFIHTIVEACAAGIPVRLEQFGAPISNHTKSLCIQLLIDSRGLREDIAEKAVDAWADVLSRKMLKMKN